MSAIAALAMSSTVRCPIRSPIAPVRGANIADENVSRPRNSPACSVEPPRSLMWKGAVGSSWNTDRNTVKLNAHIVKKRAVNSFSDAGDGMEA
jgi:hypothetical protein